MMRASVLLLGLLGPACATPDYLAMWNKFKVDFGKSYGANSDDEARRFGIFKDNVDYIESTNAQRLSYTLSVNQFADFTNEEFTKTHLGGYNPSAKRWGEESNPHPFANVSAQVPDSVDWVAKGGVTPVKNQKRCGSCWAFSSTGSLEGALFVATGKLESMSEEDLVQCDHSGDQGCQGGLMDNAFDWVKKNGICLEAGYPYTSGGGKRGSCRVPKCTPAMTITGHTDVPAKNEVALKQAVAQQPVSIAIEADKMAFQLYQGGVLDNTGCGTNLDHGVLIVGYGIDAGKEYWKVKNSWGPTWGEQGYIRLVRGKNECGVAMQASFPTGAKATGPGPLPGPTPGPAPGPSPSTPHYGDPADGCLPDEEAIRISGVEGDVCSPACTSMTCPSDVPSGVTATPTCALSGGGSKRCALICDPSSYESQCGEAECRAIQGLGICTYDALDKNSTTMKAFKIDREDTEQIIV